MLFFSVYRVSFVFRKVNNIEVVEINIDFEQISLVHGRIVSVVNNNVGYLSRLTLAASHSKYKLNIKIILNIK
jgi:hypothetical protein